MRKALSIFFSAALALAMLPAAAFAAPVAQQAEQSALATDLEYDGAFLIDQQPDYAVMYKTKVVAEGQSPAPVQIDVVHSSGKVVASYANEQTVNSGPGGFTTITNGVLDTMKSYYQSGARDGLLCAPKDVDGKIKWAFLDKNGTPVTGYEYDTVITSPCAGLISDTKTVHVLAADGSVAASLDATTDSKLLKAHPSEESAYSLRMSIQEDSLVVNAALVPGDSANSLTEVWEYSAANGKFTYFGPEGIATDEVAVKDFMGKGNLIVRTTNDPAKFECVTSKGTFTIDAIGDKPTSSDFTLYGDLVICKLDGENATGETIVYDLQGNRVEPFDGLSIAGRFTNGNYLCYEQADENGTSVYKTSILKSDGSIVKALPNYPSTSALWPHLLAAGGVPCDYAVLGSCIDDKIIVFDGNGDEVFSRPKAESNTQGIYGFWSSDIPNLYTVAESPTSFMSMCTWAVNLDTKVVIDDRELVRMATSCVRCGTWLDGEDVYKTGSWIANDLKLFREDLTVLTAGEYEVAWCGHAGAPLTRSLSDGKTLVYAKNSDGKRGVVDAEGNVLIPLEYDKIDDSGYTSTTNILLGKEGKWSFFDTESLVEETPKDVTVPSTSDSVVKAEVAVKDASPEIAEALAGLRLSVADVPQTDKDKANAALKELVANGASVAMTLDVHFVNQDGNIEAWNEPSSPITVRITMTDELKALAKERTLCVYYIADNGTATKMPTRVAGDVLEFDTTHFSNYAVVADPKTGTSEPDDPNASDPGTTDPNPDDPSTTDPEPVGTQVMYRLYNPNSGEHFYTASTVERDAVAAAGWDYEGEAWMAPVTSSTPVYRLYSGTDHHYTTSSVERDYLISIGWTLEGDNAEGIAWYSDDAEGIGLHRLFNPNVDPSAPFNNSGSHHYTTSEVERDHLISVGWQYEGIGWHGVK